MALGDLATVSSVFSLLAVVVAAGAAVLRTIANREMRLVEKAPPESRDELVAKALERFSIDTTGLSKSQKYDLAIEQLRERRHRLTLMLSAAVLLAGLFLLGFVAYNRNANGVIKPEPSTVPVPSVLPEPRQISPEPIPSATGITVVEPAPQPKQESKAQRRPPLRISKFAIDTKRSPEWGKGELECPYWAPAACRQAPLRATTGHGQLKDGLPDPVLDVTVTNDSAAVVEIFEVGIELAFAGFQMVTGGEPEQGSVTTKALYKVTMPLPTKVVPLLTKGHTGKLATEAVTVQAICEAQSDERSKPECRAAGQAPSNELILSYFAGQHDEFANAWAWAGLPINVKQQLDDSVYIKPRAAPYRFSLVLDKFERLPTDVVLRVILTTSDGVIRTPYAYLVSPGNRSGF